ncbi:MAG TPA: hypothetical protein DDZ88_00135, partial [Verrucomicrobiales bacterium]|nr:hypothetical protein [Verrucomicrobiales bacterium]
TAIFSQPSFEAFFLGVLGCPATAVNCRLVQSTPHEGEGTGPQSWHLDGCPVGVIRGVLYLTDVEVNGGPFQYKDSNGEIVTMLGEVGDCLIFDARRLQHRALPPRVRERKAVDLIFMPRLPGQKFAVNDAGMNTWPSDPFFYRVPERRIFDEPVSIEASAAKLY